MDVISFMLQTPLYDAASNGHIAVVEMLLKAGADMNKVSHFLCDLFPLWSWGIRLQLLSFCPAQDVYHIIISSTFSLLHRFVSHSCSSCYH